MLFRSFWTESTEDRWTEFGGMQFALPTPPLLLFNLNLFLFATLLFLCLSLIHCISFCFRELAARVPTLLARSRSARQAIKSPQRYCVRAGNLEDLQIQRLFLSFPSQSLELLFYIYFLSGCSPSPRGRSVITRRTGDTFCSFFISQRTLMVGTSEKVN